MTAIESVQTKSRVSAPWLRLLASVTLILLILLPRIWPFPTIYITDDEMQIGQWTSQMTAALLSGDWRNTANNAYPAVTLAWIEAVQLQLGQLLPGQSVTPAEILTDSGDSVFAALPRRRLALALLNTGMILASFWLLRRLYNNFVAVTATILLALDPFLLTQSRVFRTEGVTTGIMLLSGLTIILYARESKSRWLIVSAILGGLATLTKITSLFLLPFAGLTLLTWPLMIGQRDAIPIIKQTARDVLIWTAVMALTFFVLWPALWVAPLETFTEVYTYIQLASENIEIIWGGKGSAFFFNGQILREDPGILFYLWSLALRTTPIVLLGLGLALAIGFTLLFRRRRDPEAAPYSAMLSTPYLPVTLLVAAYVLFYFIAMGLGASKVDRYLLPIFPGFSILAAVGFQLLIDLLSPSIRVPAWIVWAGLVVVGAWLALPQHPYYFTYWNPLFGGSRQAIKILPVGGRQGINMMIEHLNQLPEASQLSLTGPGIRDCPVIFSGNCLQLSQFLMADYIVSDAFSLQRNGYLANVKELFPEAELVHHYTKNGIDYAWLYKMPADLQHVEQWLGGHGKLRGYGFSSRRFGAGEQLNVAIFWINGDEGWTLDDSEFFVELIDDQGQVRQTAPARLRLPAEAPLTTAGEMLVFDGLLDLPPDTALGSYTVEIGLRLKSSGEETWRFDLKDSDNDITVNRGALAVSPETIAIDHRLNQAIGQTGLRLVGYNDQSGTAGPHFDFFWQADQPLEETYLLELALLNQAGDPAAVWRNRLAAPIHPLTDWQTGEIVKLPLSLAVGFVLPAESYRPRLTIRAPDFDQSQSGHSVDLLPLPAGFSLGRFEANMQHRLDSATFASSLDLLGYDLKGQGDGAGGVLYVTLYWLNRDPLSPAEAQISVLDENGNIGAVTTVTVPTPAEGSGWLSVSQAELSLDRLPASVAIRARPVGSESWYRIPQPDRPDVEQIIIDDVLNKMTIVAN